MVEEGNGSFVGAGGLRIAYRTWSRSTPRPPRAVVVMVHTLYDHSARYGEFARNLVRCGIHVWVPDQRGHGISEGQPGIIDSFESTAADLRQMIQIAQRAGRGAPCFVVGHSVGANTAMRYAIDFQHEIAGLVCTSPAIDRSVLPGPIQMLMDRVFANRMIARLSTRIRTFTLDPTQMTSDAHEVALHVADPLVHHGRVPLRTATEIASTVTGVLAERVCELTLPMLVIQGDSDPIVAPETARQLYDEIGCTDKTFHLLPGMSHDLYHEQHTLRRRFNDIVADWIDDRAAAARTVELEEA